MTMTTTTIAVLGMGAMGSRMATRLLDAGHTVRVWNRTAARTEPLTAKGATAAASPREAAEGADVVLSMVRDDDAAAAVWLDEATGALAAMGPQAIGVESSTLTQAGIRRIGDAFAAKGIALLEAPVAGSRPQAEAGALIFIVGGDEAHLATIRPLLDTMGGAVHHIGPVGSAAIIKLTVNALLAVQSAAIAEILGFLDAAGLKTEAITNLLGAVPVTSPAAKGQLGLMVAGAHDPMFPIELVEKDLGYFASTAAANNGTSPLIDAVRARFQAAQAAGHGDRNISAIAALYDR